MKKISVLIPTFNEEENVELLSNVVSDIFKKKLSEYDYEVVFIDNDSTDSTRDIIFRLSEDTHIKAIFNAKNFGQIRSPFYGLTQCQGDAVILLYADFQDPPELIEDFVREWEKGYKLVIGRKMESEESQVMYFLRSCYYKVIKKIAEVDHIEHFTGFGLYDKSFIEVIKRLDDPMPYFRGIVSELGYKRKEILYKQNKRRAGKSKYNFLLLYDYAMLGITSYSKIAMRIATMFGFISAAFSFIIGIVYFILKLMYWDIFPAGTAPILIGVFFLGSIQIFFIGLLGEYILNINFRMMKRPLVIEDRRINFNEEKGD